MKTKTKQTQPSTSLDLDNIYAGIAAAETQRSANQKGDKDFLKPKAGNTYLIKLLPFKVDSSKTFVQYDFHGWQSTQPGRQYVTTGACPRTWGGKCIVCDTGYEAYGRKEEFNGDLKSKLLLKRTTHMVNVFVIEDSANPENNGTVKVLRYGPVVNQKFHDALFGEDKEEFGIRRVFDFSPDGVHFRISVEHKGGKPKAPLTYEKSKFISSAKIDFSKFDLSNILDQAKDLSTLIPKTKSDTEIASMLDKHFHGQSSTLVPLNSMGDDDSDDDQPLAKPSYVIPNSPGTDADDGVDEQVARLLEGING